MLTEFDIEIYLALTSFLLILLIDFTRSSNLVQAIVCLIFSYLLVATHFMLFNAGYLAIVLILVYVGAISVLFLWLLMTIEEVEYINDTKKSVAEENSRPFENENLLWWFIPTIIIILCLAGFVYESFGLISSHFYTLFNEPHFVWSKNDFELNDRSLDWVSMLFSSETVMILGRLLYSNFFFILMLLTILRLVTLLGGIVIIRQLDSSDLLK